MKRALLSTSLAALVLAMAGCQDRKTDGPEPQDRPPQGPTYADIAGVQNVRVDRARQLYGTGTISVDWTDDQGEDHHEGGEGNLIFRRPSEVAMLFRKLGKVYVWAGTDSDRIWLVVGGDESAAYIARVENVGRECCQPLNMPVYPGELLGLYGLLDFPAADSPDAPGVGFDEKRGMWTVDIPRGSMRWRYFYDVDDRALLPVRVALIDVDGSVLVRSLLERYEVMSTRDLGPGLAPSVPTWMTVLTGDSAHEARLTVKISAPSDVPDGHREMPAGIFDFAAIRNNMRPRQIEVLDRDCDNPALPAASNP